MIVNRSRSLRLIVNVSIVWPGCYRNPTRKGTFLSSYLGDILIEFRHCRFEQLHPWQQYGLLVRRRSVWWRLEQLRRHQQLSRVLRGRRL